MPDPRKPPSAADIVAGPNMLDTIKSLERMTAGPALLADRLMTTSRALDTIAPTTRMLDQASAATRMFDPATAVERASRIGERFGGSLPEIPRPGLTEINKSLDHLANLRAAEKRREVERQQAMVNALRALSARADAAEGREIESPAKQAWAGRAECPNSSGAFVRSTSVGTPAVGRGRFLAGRTSANGPVREAVVRAQERQSWAGELADARNSSVRTAYARPARPKPTFPAGGGASRTSSAT
jgi:hypothetical protein